MPVLPRYLGPALPRHRRHPQSLPNSRVSDSLAEPSQRYELPREQFCQSTHAHTPVSYDLYVWGGMEGGEEGFGETAGVGYLVYAGQPINPIIMVFYEECNEHTWIHFLEMHSS